MGRNPIVMTIFNLNLIVELMNKLREKDIISKQDYNDILKAAHISTLKEKAKRQEDYNKRWEGNKKP
jgi:hypothetical protein